MYIKWCDVSQINLEQHLHPMKATAIRALVWFYCFTNYHFVPDLITSKNKPVSPIHTWNRGHPHSYLITSLIPQGYYGWICWIHIFHFLLLCMHAIFVVRAKAKYSYTSYSYGEREMQNSRSRKWKRNLPELLSHPPWARWRRMKILRSKLYRQRQRIPSVRCIECHGWKESRKDLHIDTQSQVIIIMNQMKAYLLGNGISHLILRSQAKPDV